MVERNSVLFKKGIRNWLSVRISSLIILIYLIYLLLFISFSKNIDYYVWCNFFKDVKNKFFTIITLSSLIIHSWICMWQVITDYIKSNFLRSIAIFIVAIILFYYLVFGIFLIYRI